MQRPVANPGPPHDDRRRISDIQSFSLANSHLLQAILEQMPVGVIVAEAPSGKLILRNRQAAEILGAPLQPSQSALNQRAYRGFHADGRAYEWEEWPIARAIKWGREVTGEEIRVQRQDGREVYVCVNAAPLCDASGRVIGGVATFTDITERKRMEATLERTQKMATSGRLAASLAHELKNPLGALSDLMYLLGSNRDLAESSRQHVHLAENELKRAQQIISHTVGLYRESSRPIGVKVADLLDSILDFYTPTACAREIKVERCFRTAGLIQGFPAEMRQVLTNLLMNALEAVPRGGRVLVRLSDSRHWRKMDLAGVRVTFCDNGCGIQREHLRRIFDPSFTTKGDRGTGLGLWITRDIIHRRGGAIRVRSRTLAPRNGTVFSVLLPKTLVEWKAPVTSYPSTT
jgi:two-component system, chemotaxis family, CheB/CheR fusion protein